MRQPRIAVVLTAAYRGAPLEQARALAVALQAESCATSQPATVVLAYPGPAGGDWEADLPEFIERRAIEWQTVDANTAARAMLYNGESDWKPSAPKYAIAEDWMQQLCDCDVWVLVGDGLSAPLLPLRPSVASDAASGCWNRVRACL